ncbi:hypothetical protein CGCSCA5_v010850 [Colletotrichum siamense]|nr:hypothetical protein CGCSCA5_v010850 [Colletotrichum siamense]
MTEHNGGTKAHESLTLATLRSLHEAPAEWQLFGNPVSGLENPVLACKHQGLVLDNSKNSLVLVHSKSKVTPRAAMIEEL